MVHEEAEGAVLTGERVSVHVNSRKRLHVMPKSLKRARVWFNSDHTGVKIFSPKVQNARADMTADIENDGRWRYVEIGVFAAD